MADLDLKAGRHDAGVDDGLDALGDFPFVRARPVFVGGVLLNPMLVQHEIEPCRVRLAEQGAVKIENRDPIHRGDIIRAVLIRHGVHIVDQGLF